MNIYMLRWCNGFSVHGEESLAPAAEDSRAQALQLILQAMLKLKLMTEQNILHRKYELSMPEYALRSLPEEQGEALHAPSI